MRPNSFLMYFFITVKIANKKILFDINQQIRI